MKNITSILLLIALHLSITSATSWAEAEIPAKTKKNAYIDMLKERGEWVFEKRCEFCHGDKGRGLVGPNLTDMHFINGPTKKEMQAVIRDGVLERGMPNWKAMLSSSELRAVEEYVWSLRGKKLKGKDPEGTEAKE